MRPSTVFVFVPIALLFSSCSSTTPEVEEVVEDTPALTEELATSSSLEADVRGVVEREIARRQLRVKDAESLIQRGDELMNSGDLESAREMFQKAVERTR